MLSNFRLMNNPRMLMDNLHLKMEVDRNNIVENTLANISKPNINLKAPLKVLSINFIIYFFIKVKFNNEKGVDEGGVRKEYF